VRAAVAAVVALSCVSGLAAVLAAAGRGDRGTPRFGTVLEQDGRIMGFNINYSGRVPDGYSPMEMSKFSTTSITLRFPSTSHASSRSPSPATSKRAS
jgi:hypothetical protein